MTYKRQSIQSVLLTVPSTSNNAFSVQMDREHQSTISPEGKPHLPKKLFNAVPISVLAKSTAINDLIIYLHHTNVNWYWRYHSRSPCVKMSQVVMSSSFMLKGANSSDSRAPPAGLKKFFPLREWLKRLCNHHDTLPTCWERAWHRLGPQLRGCLASRPGHTSENVPVL